MIIKGQPKVFLSHSSVDKPKVRKLRNILKSHKIECWMDEKELLIGDSISKKIESALECADFLVVCFSQQSIDSNWFNIEFRSVLSSQLQVNETKILPVVFDGSEPPSLFRDFLWGDLSNTNWNDGVQALVRAIFTRFNYKADFLEEKSLRYNNEGDFKKLIKSQATHGFHLFIISGVSSVGKDVLAYVLEQRMNPKYYLTIAKKYTTRPRRPSEPEYVCTLSGGEFTERLEEGTLLFPYHKRRYQYAFDTKQFNWAIQTGIPLITIFTDFIRVPLIVEKMQARGFSTTAIFVEAKREHVLRRVLFRGMPLDEVASRTMSIEQDLCEIANRPTFKNEYLFLYNGDDRPFNEASTELLKIIKKELKTS